jgi:TPR repeat protein
MMKGTAVMMVACLLLAGCDQGGVPLSVNAENKEPSMPPLTDVNARLAFSCKHETLPEAPAKADVLFKYARWLQKNNLLKQDKAVDAEVGRLYRIAAENGHYKASINLQNGALRKEFSLSAGERLRLSQRLIDAGVATGYYFVAIYLGHGVAGLQQDPEMALRYYRKAADEGSALAQAYVGDKLAPVGMAPDIARQMLRCAAEQGMGKAAVELGIDFKINKQYQNAIEVFQLGVAAGNASSARFLGNGFDGPEPTDELYYLGQQPDAERARRYKAIGKLLSGYSYAGPVVPEINDIVPLPPAPLPEWDGKLKWVEARRANVPPEKPTEALIAELAEARQLNPATGRPLPQSADFEPDSTSRLLCHSGEACPKSGYWQMAWWPREGLSGNAIRYFREGETMPTETVEIFRPRPWPLSDIHQRKEQAVWWRRVGEA